MIILGIDPGTLITGYGFLSVNGSKRTALDFGCIRPPGKMALADRYLAIHEGLHELLRRFQADAVAVETQYVHKNPQSALKLGMARGVAILAARQHQLPIYEYTPGKAKLAVVGSGRASKRQVQEMIQRLLRLPQLPEPEDAADALALAYCHCNALTLRNNLGHRL